MHWFWIMAAAVFVLDQGSKWLVVDWLDLRNRLMIDVFPPFLRFRMGWNEGINFGLLAHEAEAMRWALAGLALAVSAWLVWWSRARLGHPVARGAAGAVAGGAIGNALDRALHGAVADFLNMSCCGIVNPFAFNLADVGIFGGAILLIFTAERHAKG